ncbi:DUF1232 domain-containing protein [candidate division GN15 bacterium]|nr:DUF1232 domain-containing protein [candidate division GN15 bacterium]
MLSSWKSAANRLRREIIAIFLACRDPRTPWYARVLAVCLVAYAASPIDLIPDPIPLLGVLDDLILLPLGVLILRRLIPNHVMADCRRQAARISRLPRSRLGAAMVVVAWAAAVVLVVWWAVMWVK